jgi:hypothetical protein
LKSKSSGGRPVTAPVRRLESTSAVDWVANGDDCGSAVPARASSVERAGSIQEGSTASNARNPIRFSDDGTLAKSPGATLSLHLLQTTIVLQRLSAVDQEAAVGTVFGAPDGSLRYNRRATRALEWILGSDCRGPRDRGRYPSEEAQ